jgi:AraC-like DNA-binding protein
MSTAKDCFRFLPVSPRDQQWGLYVTAVGYESVPPGGSYPFQGHSRSHDWVWQHGRVLQEYAVQYVARGQGEFQSKSIGTKAIDAGSAILLFPGVWHRYRPLKEVGWEAYWVVFQGEYADRLCDHGFLNPEEPVLFIGLDDFVLHAFTTLSDRARSEAHGCQQLLAVSALEIIVGILNGVQRQRTNNHIQEIVRRAKAAMESSADETPTINDLAEELGLSPSYFYQVFKEHTGLPPHQYRLQWQMSRAKELLQHSDASVKQIAHAAMFHSVYQFSKAFKKKTGMTPGQYRRGGRLAKVDHAGSRR